MTHCLPSCTKAAKDTKHTLDTPDFSDVDEFVAKHAQQEQWDAMSRYATPDMTLIAFRLIAISLISTAAFILFGIRRMPATHG